MKKTVLLGVTASIAAYKACELIRLFAKKNMDVKCVLSRDADKFVTPLTLQTLSGNKVHAEMFDLPERMNVEHVSLADQADCVLIAPATADIISRVAAGLCDDLLTTVVCAAAVEKPVIFAPAMNRSMYANPVLRDKMDYLSKKGYKFVDAVEGDLACGDRGLGHLAELKDIVSLTISSLAG